MAENVTSNVKNAKNSGRYFVRVLTFELEFWGGCGKVGEYSRPVKPPSNGHWTLANTIQVVCPLYRGCPLKRSKCIIVERCLINIIGESS